MFNSQGFCRQSYHLLDNSTIHQQTGDILSVSSTGAVEPPGDRRKFQDNFANTAATEPKFSQRGYFSFMRRGTSMHRLSDSGVPGASHKAFRKTSDQPAPGDPRGPADPPPGLSALSPLRRFPVAPRKPAAAERELREARRRRPSERAGGWRRRGRPAWPQAG